jgi:hypothetical protein
MNEKKLAPVDVMSLAKGFYNLHKAGEYFKSVKGNPNVAPPARAFLIAMLNKIGWCMTEMKMKLGADGIKAFHDEITNGDTLQFDAVFDEMIRMTPGQREMVESMAVGIRKGEIQLVNQ